MPLIDSRLEDYLDGTLPEQERMAFETELASNPELSAQLALANEARQRLVRLWAHEEADKALNAQLREMGTVFFKEEQPGPSRSLAIRRVWWYSAAAAVIILLVWVFGIPSREQRLYSQVRHFPEANFVSKGTENQYLERAGQLFNKKQYKEALPEFQAYLNERPDNLEARLYTAFCQLETGDFRSAEANLGILSNSSWAEEAEWFLALVYLKEKDINRCREQLQRIKADSRYAPDAREVFSRL